jgi:hypothetical protein
MLAITNVFADMGQQAYERLNILDDPFIEKSMTDQLNRTEYFLPGNKYRKVRSTLRISPPSLSNTPQPVLCRAVPGRVIAACKSQPWFRVLLCEHGCSFGCETDGNEGSPGVRYPSRHGFVRQGWPPIQGRGRK